MESLDDENKEKKEKLVLINVALNQLIEERNNKSMDQGDDDDDEEETFLLSRLLSQVLSLSLSLSRNSKVLNFATIAILLLIWIYCKPTRKGESFR